MSRRHHPTKSREYNIAVEEWDRLKQDLGSRFLHTGARDRSLGDVLRIARAHDESLDTLVSRFQLRVIPHMPMCNVILGSRFLRHYDPLIRWSKRYLRIHGVRIPFMDCGVPSQELQPASVTVVDPTPQPIHDVFGDGDPCLPESPSSPGSFSVSPHLEDNGVRPVVFAETPTYEKFDSLLSNLPDDARFELHRIGSYEKEL